jgi:biotin carboxyl carrier protein
MPGTVSAVHVAEGDRVGPGQPVVTVEAMKMEHVVRARGSGVVRALLVTVGQPVALDAELATLERATLERATLERATRERATRERTEAGG